MTEPDAPLNDDRDDQVQSQDVPDAAAEIDPVPIQPIEPIDPADPIDPVDDDGTLAPKQNFLVTLKYPATAADVEAGCSATFLTDGDLQLPIRQLGGNFRFRAVPVPGVDYQFLIRVQPTSTILSKALLFLVQVPVPNSNAVQIGLAYGRVVKRAATSA